MRNNDLSEPADRLVSVIMPAYNGERYIGQSICSVLAQTHKSLELIVVDDGSIDGTCEVIRGIQEKDERVKYLFQQNRGQGAARNKGICASKGDLVAFLDQDDLWLEKKLELQIREMKESNADIVFSNGYVFAEDDKNDVNTTFPLVYGRFDGREMFRLLFMQNRIPVLTALVQKDFIVKSGLMEEDRRYQNCDDYDLWLSLARSGASFSGMNDKLVRYRIHSCQASIDGVQMLKAELAVVKKHLPTDLVDEREKLKRVKDLHLRLAAALLVEGRKREAKTVLKDLLAEKVLDMNALLQLLALNVFPGYHSNAYDLTNRAVASFTYRVIEPVSNFVSKSRHS